MVNANLVAAKLANLEDRIGRVRHHCPADADAFDRDALDLVSFNLLLAVQACADIASHVVLRRRPVCRPPFRPLRGSVLATIAGISQEPMKQGGQEGSPGRIPRGTAELGRSCEVPTRPPDRVR